MFQGFYNLGSEMLCQTRNMNVISNNMANVATAGFKRDDFQVSAFREVMMSRYQGSSDTSPAALGNMAMVGYDCDRLFTGDVQGDGKHVGFCADNSGIFPCADRGRDRLYKKWFFCT